MSQKKPIRYNNLFKFNNIFKGIENSSPNFKKFFLNVTDVFITYRNENFHILKELRGIDRFVKVMKRFSAYCDINHSRYMRYRTYRVVHDVFINDFFENVKCSVTYMHPKKYREYQDYMMKKEYYDSFEKPIYYFNKTKNKTSIELLELLKKNKNKNFKFYLLNLF